MRQLGKQSLTFVLVTFLLAAAPAAAQERIGFGLEPWLEGAGMSGETSIQNATFDESFDYGSLGLTAMAWMLFQAKERFRAGPAVRVYGNYRARGNNDFHFGFLSEALFLGEYSLHAAEKFDAIFGFRLGVPVLFPGGDLRDEVNRLRRDDVSVSTLPRFGFLAGGTVGTRRKMTDKIWLRADLTGQYEQLILFTTNRVIDDLRFRKSWRTHSVRVGLQLGAELGL